MTAEITKKEKVYTQLDHEKVVIATHNGTPDDSVDVRNYTIFIGDKETEKELVAALFMQFPLILTIEIIRFNTYGTIYERTTK